MENVIGGFWKRKTFLEKCLDSFRLFYAETLKYIVRTKVSIPTKRKL